MSDEVDRASDLIEMAETVGVAHSRATFQKAPSPVTHCVECDDVIDPRRKVSIPSTDLCGPCASFAEQKMKHSSGRW